MIVSVSGPDILFSHVIETLQQKRGRIMIMSVFIIFQTIRFGKELQRAMKSY